MSFLDHYRLAPKLLSVPIVLVAAMAGMGWYSQAQLQATATSTDEMYALQLKPLVDLGEMAESFQRARGNLIEAVYVSDPEKAKALLSKIAERDAEVKARVESYQSTIRTEEGKKAFADLTSALDEFTAARTTMMAAIDRGDQAAALTIWTEQCEPARTKVQDAMEKVQKTKIAIADERVAEADSAAVTVRDILLGSTVLSVLFGLGLGITVSRNLASRAEALSGMAKRVALGEIVTVNVEGADELAEVSRAFASVVQAQATLAAAATRVAAGDPTVEVKPRGPDDALSHAFVKLIDTTRNLTTDLQQLVAAAQRGALSERGDAARFQGSYASIVKGINQMLDAIVAPISEAAQVLDRVAARDMTARVHGSYAGEYDRIKTSLNSAVGTLEESLQQVARGAEQVSAAANQIASSAQAVAQGASEQASALEETSASLETMSSVTSQNAQNASQADGLARTAKVASDQGIEAMAGMNQAMERIRMSAERTAAIIRDINDIAFQTNLLALNAAVEAARAGDAGRGFAVVAEEVRNLAMRSKEAAKKTETLIQESVDLARQGEGMSQQVNTNLEEIVTSVSKVSAIVTEIATASAGQARGIQEVNRAVGEMEKVTQQNAANAEEAASAVEELSGQTRELTGMVSRFELSGEGRPVVRAPAKPIRAPSPAQAAPIHKRAPPPPKPSAESVFPLDDEPAFRDF